MCLVYLVLLTDFLIQNIAWTQNHVKTLKKDQENDQTKHLKKDHEKDQEKGLRKDQEKDHEKDHEKDQEKVWENDLKQKHKLIKNAKLYNMFWFNTK